MACRQGFVALLVLLVVGGVQGKDARMKLCGRDLVRMVVSSCGSSRLRRSLPELEPRRHHANSLDDPLTWPHSDHPLTTVGSPQSTEEEEEGVPGRREEEERNAAAEARQAVPGIPGPQQPQGGADEEEDEEHVAPHWYPVSARTRRGLKGPAQVCCEVGCSVNELIQYC